MTANCAEEVEMPIKRFDGGGHRSRTKGWRVPMMYVVENTRGNLSRYRRLSTKYLPPSFHFLPLDFYFFTFLPHTCVSFHTIFLIFFQLSPKKQEESKKKKFFLTYITFGLWQEIVNIWKVHIGNYGNY